MSDQITLNYLSSILSYDPETGVFRWKVERRSGRSRWKLVARPGDIAGTVNTLGYVVIRAAGKVLLAHRIAFLLQTGKWPKNLVDHANMIRSDNRWSNLRQATKSENMRNMGATSRSKCGLKGVVYTRNRWRARIRANGKNIHLGVFDSPEKAHAAYVKAAEVHHGEFARAGV